MRKRNPDEQAYRAWQADRSDREALQRYLSSMARDREILDDPERIIELDEAVGQDEALRPIYTRVRPDYSSAATPFREERWRTLVDRYAGRNFHPQAALILVEMGLRSGVPMEDVYRILYERKIVEFDVFRSINSIQSEQETPFGIIYSEFVYAIPALINFIENDDRSDVRLLCVRMLGYLGSVARSAVPQLIISLENDANLSVRSFCAIALGNIGPVATVVDALRNAIRNNHNVYVRISCAYALGEIGPDAASAVPQIIESIQDLTEYYYEEDGYITYHPNVNHPNVNCLRHFIDSLGKIGPSAASSVELLNRCLHNYDNPTYFSCRRAIELITGKDPDPEPDDE